jgi:hypothetical protein
LGEAAGRCLLGRAMQWDFVTAGLSDLRLHRIGLISNDLTTSALSNSPSIAAAAVTPEPMARDLPCKSAQSNSNLRQTGIDKESPTRCLEQRLLLPSPQVNSRCWAGLARNGLPAAVVSTSRHRGWTPNWRARTCRTAQCAFNDRACSCGRFRQAAGARPKGCYVENGYRCGRTMAVSASVVLITQQARRCNLRRPPRSYQRRGTGSGNR